MRQYHIIVSLLFLFVLIGPILSVQSQIPNFVSYQGELTDTVSGEPITDTVSMTFWLYTSSTGGAPMWGEVHETVAVRNGIYDVLLGTGVPVTGLEDVGVDDLAFDAPYYLEVAINDDPPFEQRYPLSAVPYARNAATVPNMIVKNGKIGIGTQPDREPDAKLHISGGGLKVSHSETLLFVGTPETGTPITDGFRLRQDLHFFGPNRDVILIEKTDANGPGVDGGICFVNTDNTGTTPSLVIRGNGKIGLGGLTDPAHTLDIHGDLGVSNDLTFGASLKGGADRTFGIYANTNATDSRVYFEAWGPHATRGGELTVAGTSVNLRYNSTDTSWGVVGLRLTPQGRVGIGTPDPEHTLDIHGTMRVSSHLVFGGNIAGGADRSFNLFMNTNSVDSRAYILAWGPHATRTGELTLAGSYVDLRHGSTDQSTGTVGFRLTSDGNVGIGTTTPTHRLTVHGAIRVREEVIVDADPNHWPDRVFEPGYDLMPLEEVAAYIRQHRHLPDVPNRKEVTAQGIKLSAMQVTLLQKVEELTLHTIQLQQENEALRQQLEALNARLSVLEE